MRILIVGRLGQVAWELRRALLPLAEVTTLDRSTADLARPESLAPVLRAARPDVLVNAAAYTAVDKAESARALALTINGESVGVMAREAAALGALFVHYSTDYVFDGAKPAAYLEDDATRPLGAYGESKRAGELAIAASGADHLILRTSWVYASRGANFVRTILRLARERETLAIVADQTGAPTWARFIADATAQVVAQAQARRAAGRFDGGLYHLSAGGETTWHGLAGAVVAMAREIDPALELRVREIRPITTAEYPLPAVRPANSRLSCEKLQRHYGVVPCAWETALRLCLEELLVRG